MTSTQITRKVLSKPKDFQRDKKLILLDLDNTLICAEDLDSNSCEQSLADARKKFRTVRMEDYYDIFERPHLQEFLNYLFENFKVGVWTASSKDYAIFVIENFITRPENMVLENRKIELFLCSHHCNVSKRYFKGVSKDLKLISDKWNLENLNNIILIDDLENLAKHQPGNMILVKPFYHTSEKDDELLKVKSILNKYLS